MKRILSIICLFVILFQSTSQLFILGSFYLNREYISKNECVNRFEKIPLCKGQCYLTKELKENEKKTEKFPNLKQKQINLYLEETLNLRADTFDVSKDQPLDRSTNTNLSKYAGSIFHPPQQA